MHENNILDLVFFSSPDMADNLSAEAPSSDHNSITFSKLGSPYERRKTQKLYYAFTKADCAHLRDLLHYISWDCAFLDNDLDNNWTAWSNLLFSAIQDCIPTRKQSARHHAPWIAQDAIKLCKKKKSLYRKAKRSGRASDWNEYHTLNNS